MQRAIAGRCTLQATSSRAGKLAVQRAICFRCQDNFTRRRGGGDERVSDPEPLLGYN